MCFQFSKQLLQFELSKQIPSQLLSVRDGDTKAKFRADSKRHSSNAIQVGLLYFFVNFVHVSPLYLMFLLLALSK